MSPRAALGALTAAMLVAACTGGGQRESRRAGLELGEAEIRAAQRLEGEVVFPAPPRDADLVPVRTSRATSFEYFVDARSVDVTRDRLVRFTLIAKSDAGARNVSYVGLRCASRERRSYGFLRPDGTWARASSDEWARLPAVESGDVVNNLWRDVFCAGGVPPANNEAALRTLRAGGNPQLITQ